MQESPSGAGRTTRSPRATTRSLALRLRLIALLLLALLAPPALPAAVVVELFTSQGCSSCPPADRLLTRLGGDPTLAGQVIPLAFHVDYWNWIGWRDPFSSAAWSQRQRGYAAAFRSDRVYTPQAVVGGRRDCNGGDLRCIRAAVASLAAEPAGEARLAFAPDAAGALQIVVTARPPAGSGPLDVMLALYEKGLDTRVGRGENADKTLHNDYVVRSLQRAFRLESGGPRRATVPVPLDPAWTRRALGVAVFLQDPAARRIYAAASSAVPAR